MSNFVQISTHSQFRSAADRAQREAHDRRLTTQIVRRGAAWAVLVPDLGDVEGVSLDAATSTSSPNTAPAYDDEEVLDDLDESRKEIMSEVFDYGDSLARSDEEGWFYADDDEQ